MAVIGLVLFTAFLIGTVVLLASLVASLRPVSRERIERFVVRTSVPFTESNATFVVDSLARTMRWRAAGVIVAAGACIAWDVVRGTLTFTVPMGVALAFSFLVGCVIGEVRNAVARGDGPRTASLTRRSESDFVGDWARAQPFGWMVAGVGFAVLFIALGRGPWWEAVVVAAVGVVSWALGRWATRVVVDRPRPATTDADVLAADDGLRSRALHAVGGAVLLASSWVVVSLAVSAVVPEEARPDNSMVAVLAWVAIVALARWAWVRATAPFTVRSAAQATVRVRQAATDEP